MKRKWIAPLFISSMFVFGNSVLAEETESSYDPGTTPDQFLYTFDQLVEEIQLFFATGSEKTDLLLQFAQERLAEAMVMTEEEKQDFVQKALEDYLKILTDTEENIGEMIVTEKIEEEELMELDEKLNETTELDEALEEILDGELLEEIEEKQEILGKLPSIVNGLDETMVKGLRDSGLGYGQIAQAFLLANATGKTVEEVAALFSGEDKGFGDVAKELGIHPSELAGKKKASRNIESETDETKQEDVVVEEATDSTEIESDEESNSEVDADEELNSEVVADGQTAIATNSVNKQSDEAKRVAEDQRKLAEKQKEEAKRVAEEQRKAAEKQQEEAKRQAEEQRKAAEKQQEDAKRQAEEQRKAAEKQKEDAKRKAEEQRKAVEKQKEETKRQAEQQGKEKNEDKE